MSENYIEIIFALMQNESENPLNILKTRYVKGDIPQEEFDKMKSELE